MRSCREEVTGSHFFPKLKPPIEAKQSDICTWRRSGIDLVIGQLPARSSSTLPLPSLPGLGVQVATGLILETANAPPKVIPSPRIPAPLVVCWYSRSLLSGLVVRGRHYIVVRSLAKLQTEDRINAIAATHSVVPMFGQTLSNKNATGNEVLTWTGLASALPDYVHIVTLSLWKRDSYGYRDGNGNGNGNG
ncbi:unnamed protein product, partial [Protopolystoma xenopodis]